MTTLTREALLDRLKLRYEEVDVPGFGRVGIRSNTEVKRIQRAGQWSDDASQRRVHALIDQVMLDEKTPMFSEADVDVLMQMDSGRIDPLYVAVSVFNGSEDDAMGEDESSDTSDG